VKPFVVAATGISVASLCFAAMADEPTPGYPERVLQWTVQEGETCADIASSLYGSAQHVPLLQRYNAIRCGAGKLAVGTTLVVPEKVTSLPTATLRSMKPDVRARPPGGGWAPASQGMPLERRYSVNTMDNGRADIRFIDRTRVFLAENTLVVIFGTAGQTSVSKTPPARVQLEEGEVQTGLAALRGDAVEVDVEGGGRVSASSRETIVKKKVARTTVSVFDGSATVRSGGSKVAVPEKMGTSFVRAKPPTPPRPLPAAPNWNLPTASGVVLASPGNGVLNATWSEIPKTKVYRFEVARDPAFSDLVVREEVPKDVRAFRAEKMPPGTYFLRVRAIDDEDFVGIAASTREMVLLDVRQREARPGEVRSDELLVHPYAELVFDPNPQLEMAFDDGPFGPIVPTLDLRKQAPRAIRLRPRGSDSEQKVAVRYVEATATIQAANRTADGVVPVRVVLHGFEGVDVARRVAPILRVHRGTDKTDVALVAAQADGTEYSANLALGGDEEQVRMDVVDGRGVVLGSQVADLSPPDAAFLLPGKVPLPPGIAASPFALSEGLSVPWWGPGARSSGHVGGALAIRDDGPAGQLHIAAVGRIGDFALDTRIASDPLGVERGADGAAWAGAHWTVVDVQPEGRIGIEPSLRFGIPMSGAGPDARMEPAIAVGSLAGRWTWAIDVGLRQRLEDDEDRAPTPSTHGFLMAGGTYDATTWLRLFGVLDGHLLKDEELLGRAGFGVGGETTGTLFGGLALRAAPWEDAGGMVSGHLTVGVRDE
jgi:FecR protein